MFKSAFKRIVCFIFCILLVVCSFPVNAFAEQESIELTLETYLSSSKEPRMVQNYEALASRLDEQLKNFEPSINIYDFKLKSTPENQQIIVDILSGGLPECFHIDLAFQISTYGEYIGAIVPNYIYTQDEYNQMLAECEAAADKMLQGVEGNNNLSDVEKLLILHDRIAVSCEYDEERLEAGMVPQISHSMYGAFVNKLAVCQGYALAYEYMLNRIGIENYYVGSELLYHAWNIVYVDGKPYHVDITWDDNPWDVTGKVTHKNFLVSTEKFIANGHYASDGDQYIIDYDTSPDDTTYDNYFWQDIESAFVQLDDEIYYIDSINKAAQNQRVVIKRYSDNEIIYETEELWMVGNAYYPGNFARLSSCGSELLFSLSDGIYSFNPKNSKVKLVQAKPSLGVGFNIYGFTYSDGMLIYDLSISPFFNSETKKLYEYKVPYVPKEDLPYTPGDINDDGDVTLTDVVFIAQYVAEWDVVCNELAVDVNGDESVNLQDVTHLAQYVADWEGVELH